MLSYFSKLTKKEVSHALASRSVEFAQSFQAQTAKFLGSITKDGFEELLAQYIQLLRLRQGVKMVYYHNDSSYNSKEERELAISQINQIKRKLHIDDMQLLSKYGKAEVNFSSTGRQKHLDYPQEKDEQKMQEHSTFVESQITSSASESGNKQELLQIQHLTQENEKMKQNYLRKLQQLSRLCFDEEPIQMTQERLEIQHVYAKMQQYLGKNAHLLKNAEFFNDINDNLKKFLKQILAPLQEKKDEENHISNILLSKDDIKQQFQRILQAYQQYISENQTNSQLLKSQVNQFQDCKKQKEGQIESLQTEMTALNKKVQWLNHEITNRNKNIVDIQNHLRTKENNIARLNQTVKRRDDQIADLSNRISVIQNEHSIQNQKQLDKYNTKINSIRKIFQHILSQLATFKETLSKLRNDATQNNFISKLHENSFQNILKSFEANLQLQLKENKEPMDQYQQEILDLKLMCSEQELQTELATSKAQEQALAREDAQRKLAKLTLDLKDLNQNNVVLKNKLLDTPPRDYDKYFPNEILSNLTLQKKFLIDTLENRYYVNMTATRLLYRFDPFNKTNFHKYIDGQPDLLLLLKLQNGRIIACYSKDAFKQECRGDEAILIVLNTEKVFQLRSGMRAISYDDYYILFGNSEMRLKSGEDIVFSNFGIANSFFDNKGQTVDALFGEGKDKRELPIEGYEIYQLMYN